jgi:tetratricopeptide (TPR) repeat protein/TolB-like protein
MSGLRRLVSEIHRRSLWQVLGIYLGGSWVAYQVVLSLVQGLGLPDWVPPVALILFLIGLPVVMATAFVQDRSPPAASPEEEARAERGEEAGDGVQPGAEPPSSTSPRPPPPALPATLTRPTTPLTWRRAGIAGGSAFLGLGVLVAGFMLMQRAGIGPVGSLAAKGELGEVPTVLLAELDPITGDSALARVVTEALRVDLSQSTFLSTVDRSRIRHTLDRMGRPPEVRLDGDLAREVAIRMGVAVVAEGDVSRAGSGYNLSLRLVTPDSGRVVASYRETASDSTDILGAVDRLSRRLRSHAGESLRTVRASPPLRDVTTSSLPALQLYVQALDADQQMDGPRRDQLLREALVLDPDFASVKRSLGILFYNRGSFPDSALFYLEEALRLEHRMTEVERRATRGQLGVVTGRFQDALVEYTVLSELQPEVPAVWSNRGHALDLLGRFAEAEVDHRRARELGDRRPAPGGWNLVRNLLAQGRAAEARELVDEIEAEYPDHANVSRLRQYVLLAEGDVAGALAVGEARGWPTEDLDLLQGRLGGMLTVLGQAHLDSNHVFRFWGGLEKAYLELWVLEDATAAARTLLDALADPGLDDLPPSFRPLGWPAFVLAAAGRPTEARAWRSRHEAELPEALRPREQALEWATEALALGAEGRLEEAIALLRRARQDRLCPACWEPMAARLFEAAGRPDSAAVAWARYADTPWMDAWSYFQPWEGPTHFFLLAPAHGNAARLFRELGEVAEAERHEARFLELWSDPDPMLRPRVDAVRLR